jgi:hypothetical protein
MDGRDRHGQEVTPDIGLGGRLAILLLVLALAVGAFGWILE